MMKSTDISSVRITDGLLAEKQKLISDVTIPYIWKALNNEIEGIEPSSALDNFRVASGESNAQFFGLVSQDSDLYKWLEAASYSLLFSNDAADNIKSAVELLSRAQQKDGYLNSYYIANGLKNRWNYLKESCQLYCAGHLIEAAVANYEVTGDSSLLDIAESYANCIDMAFGNEPGKLNGYDGHAEIELALYKLYEATGKETYKRLADYFVEERGKQPYFFSKEIRNKEVSANLVYELEQADYHHSQSHLPIREQKEAKGHAVKAMYFFCAAADKARLSGDTSLYETVDNLWEDVVSRKMYLTGAIGSTERGEAFTYGYDLPPDRMYGETCASIGLFLLSYRLLLIKNDSKYADIMELALYNNILAGMSENGTEFFYTNILECDPEKIKNRNDYAYLSADRKRWFECPCCPPNIARLLLSLNKYLYTVDGNNVALHLFASSELDTDCWSITLKTEYPVKPTVYIDVQSKVGKGKFFVRVPRWSDDFICAVDGNVYEVRKENGYAVFEFIDEENHRIDIQIGLVPRKVYANTKAKDYINRAAVMVGPVVYCAESIDNCDFSSLLLKRNGTISMNKNCLEAEAVVIRDKSNSLYSFVQPDYETCLMKMIPYRSWNNRGKCEMKVFFNEV